MSETSWSVGSDAAPESTPGAAIASAVAMSSERRGGRCTPARCQRTVRGFCLWPQIFRRTREKASGTTNARGFTGWPLRRTS